MIKTKFAILSVLAASALLFAGCYLASKDNTNATSTTNTNEVVANSNSTNVNQASTANVDTSDWLTYSNSEYGYQFQYPDILFSNYTSQEKFPFTRVSITDAPTERAEDSFVQTKSELQAEQEELQSATVDDRTFVLLPSGIKVKAVISRAEGGSIIKRYFWYDQEYQYSFTCIFPSYEFTLEDFLNEYDTTDKVNDFIEQVQNGTADAKYQDQFNLYDSVMDTLVHTTINSNDWQTYTNAEYGFGFQYPTEMSMSETSNFKYTQNLDFAYTVSLVKNETEKDDTLLDFSVTNFSLSELSGAIEKSDVLPNGDSLAKIRSIENVTVNGLSASKGSHATAIGIATNFYYVPLKNGNAVFIFYHENQVNNDDGLIQKVISTLTAAN